MELNGAEAEADDKGDQVSPVYEDVEDFATAIAKLRSLLEQRESNGNPATSPCDPRSLPPWPPRSVLAASFFLERSLVGRVEQVGRWANGQRRGRGRFRGADRSAGLGRRQPRRPQHPHPARRTGDVAGVGVVGR